MANKTFLGSVHRNCPEQFEAPASVAITPGMLCLLAAGELKPNDQAGGALTGGSSFSYIAKELTAGGTVDDVYAIGDTAQTYIPHSGELYQMLVATGQTLVKDSPLASNGAGLLRLAVAATGAGSTYVLGDEVVAFSDETVTTVATTKVRVKIK